MRVHESRRFIDTYGFSWQVCELWPLSPRGRGVQLADEPLARGWLYFFSRGTTLVLRDYPVSWEELSWSDLDTLRRQAQILGSDTVIRLQPPPSTPELVAVRLSV